MTLSIERKRVRDPERSIIDVDDHLTVYRVVVVTSLAVHEAMFSVDDARKIVRIDRLTGARSYRGWESNSLDYFLETMDSRSFKTTVTLERGPAVHPSAPKPPRTQAQPMTRWPRRLRRAEPTENWRTFTEYSVTATFAGDFHASTMRVVADQYGMIVYAPKKLLAALSPRPIGRSLYSMLQLRIVSATMRWERTVTGKSIQAPGTRKRLVFRRGLRTFSQGQVGLMPVRAQRRRYSRAHYEEPQFKAVYRLRSLKHPQLLSADFHVVSGIVTDVVRRGGGFAGWEGSTWSRVVDDLVTPLTGTLVSTFDCTLVSRTLLGHPTVPGLPVLRRPLRRATGRVAS